MFLFKVMTNLKFYKRRFILCDKEINRLVPIDLKIYMFGYRYNQLPGLIEQTPQWLPWPSPLLPVSAGPLADYQTGFKLCSTRCNFYSTIGMG
jgi:hypothetical protein